MRLTTANPFSYLTSSLRSAISSTSSEYMLKKILVLLLIWGWLCDPVAEGRYKCTLKNFIRLGNSCYFLSSEIASWQEAHFRCRDRGAQLAVLASHYEDNTLRSYLERPEFAQLGRWIGGMWAAGKWTWAAQGTEIDSPRSFVSTDAYQVEDEEQWMCLFMDPSNRYRWNNENCMRQFHYICEAPLARDLTTSSEEDQPGGAVAATASAPLDFNNVTDAVTTEVLYSAGATSTSTSTSMSGSTTGIPVENGHSAETENHAEDVAESREEEKESNGEEASNSRVSSQEENGHHHDHSASSE